MSEEEQQKQIRNIIIEYTIPYALDLADSINREDGRIGYIVTIKGIPSMVRTERVPKEEPSIPGVVFSPYGKVKNDRYGILSRTKVQVWFDSHLFSSGLVDMTNARLIPRPFFHFSLDYVNKMIREYRVVTGEYWPQQLRIEDIVGYNYAIIFEDGSREFIQVPISHEVQFSDKNPALGAEKEQIFINLLQNEVVHLQEDLWLSILDDFDRGAYNVSLIQCAILFENYVYSNLKKNLSKTKLDRLKKKSDCGCHVGIQEVCQRGLMEVFQFKFDETIGEFKQLKDNVLKKRNDLVHGEQLEPISKEECVLAINSTNAAIQYLKDGLFSSIENNDESG